MSAECRVEGCEKPRGKEHTLCRMHRARMERRGSTDPGPYAQASVAERFLRHVTPGDSDECWLWQGALNNRGYGQMTVIGGRRVYAHRVSYESHVGPIPDGLLILHSCDVPACVNPHHLRPGNHVDNSRDMVSRGRAAWQRKATS